MIKVLFVCMGNICRSPTAHGVFEHLVREQGLDDVIVVDSAGTHAYHVGSSPDRRAQATAKGRGFDLSKQRARRVVAQDFEQFDYIVAMDRDNLEDLQSINTDDNHFDKVSLMLEFAPQLKINEVPDPYYGGESGFERVFDLVEEAAQGLLSEIRTRHFPDR